MNTPVSKIGATEAAKNIIDTCLKKMEEQSRSLSFIVGVMEKAMTEGECFKSKEYKAAALMQYRLDIMIQCAKEIINK